MKSFGQMRIPKMSICEQDSRNQKTTPRPELRLVKGADRQFLSSGFGYEHFAALPADPGRAGSVLRVGGGRGYPQSRGARRTRRGLGGSPSGAGGGAGQPVERLQQAGVFVWIKIARTAWSAPGGDRRPPRPEAGGGEGAAGGRLAAHATCTYCATCSTT